MTQEEYDKIQKRLNKGYDLRQDIARTESALQIMLSARKETDNYLPLVSLKWEHTYYMDRPVELSNDTKRKIMDLVTDDLVARLEQLKKQFDEL